MSTRILSTIISTFVLPILVLFNYEVVEGQDIHIAGDTAVLVLTDSDTDYNWRILGQDSEFVIQDDSWSRNIFRIHSSARDNSLVISNNSSGGASRIGIGTETPLDDIHLQGGSQSNILLDQSGPGHDWRIEADYYFAIENPSNGNRLFYIESNAPNSALGISDNGRVGLGTLNPTASLHVVPGSDARLSSGGYLVLGPTNSNNVVIDNNEIMARNNGATAPLYLNHDGGAIYARGIQNIGDHKNMQFNSSTGEIGWDNSSRRDKINIRTMQGDWTKVFQTRPVTYSRPRSPDRWEYGYIAEEMDSIGLTNLVGYDAEGRPDDVKYDRMVIYLTEVIKNMHARMIALEGKIARLVPE